MRVERRNRIFALIIESSERRQIELADAQRINSPALFMILRRYGNNVTSVAPNFDSRAITEISFTRTGEKTIPSAEFERRHERTAGHELTARAAGEVQSEVKNEVLADLQQQLEMLDRELADDAFLLIENEPGKDLAKTRGTQKTKVVQGSNRLQFEYSIDPPLKLGVYVER